MTEDSVLPVLVGSSIAYKAASSVVFLNQYPLTEISYYIHKMALNIESGNTYLIINNKSGTAMDLSMRPEDNNRSEFSYRDSQ